MIRLTRPEFNFAPQDLQAILEVLRSGWLVQGEQVANFEYACQEYLHVKHAVAVSSGTAALHLALLALGITKDDLVITTAFSFIATANVIELVGAEPVFVDIDLNTLNMSPEHLEERLLTLKRQGRLHKVKAILPVHLFGLPVEQCVFEIAQQYQIPVIEDAAGALGSKLQDRFVGTFGRLGCFSLHPRKIITTCEGGVVVTNDDRLAKRIRALRNHGIRSGIQDLSEPGFNYRLTEIQGVMGYYQLKRIEEFIRGRRGLVSRYIQLFRDRGLPVEVPYVSPEKRHVYQGFVVLLPEGTTVSQRDQIIQYMQEMGIETTVGTWHLPLSTYYVDKYGYQWGDFPNTDQAFARSLSLPLWPGMVKEEQERVVIALGRAIEKLFGGLKS